MMLYQTARTVATHDQLELVVPAIQAGANLDIAAILHSVRAVQYIGGRFIDIGGDEIIEHQHKQSRIDDAKGIDVCFIPAKLFTCFLYQIGKNTRLSLMKVISCVNHCTTRKRTAHFDRDWLVKTPIPACRSVSCAAMARKLSKISASSNATWPVLGQRPVK
jgi:hypothetical protein